MLTITIYKNVPLQNDYANVMLYHDVNDVISYLSQYQEGTISNINKFFSNETYIDLTILFEGCNYMCIYDDRSVKPYKFFFITNQYFISGGAVRYEISLDAWTTYSYDITFKPSRLIQGHTDAFNITDCKRNLVNKPFGANNLILEKPLIAKWSNVKNATMFILMNITTGSGDNTQNRMWLEFTHITSDEELIYSIQKFQSSKLHLISDATKKGTYKIIQAFIVNDFDFKTYLDDYAVTHGFNAGQGYNEAYVFEHTTEYGSDDIPVYSYINMMFKFDPQSQSIIHEAIPFEKLLLKQINLFNLNESFNNRIQRMFKQYRIGSLTTNEELKIDSEFNNTMSLYLYIYNPLQITFVIECNGVNVNVTNDFAIPFLNDNYTLYLSQNQATIDANNKSVAVSSVMSLALAGLSILLSPATAGASAIAGASALAGAVNTGMQAYKMRAQLEDAKKQPNRIDGQFNAGIITLVNGMGLLSYNFDNTTEMQTDYNNFGTSQSVFINDYASTDASLYNFYFIQFDDINFYGDFNYNIKNILSNIFTKGVRIWCDKTQYLNNVNYKK